MVKMVSHYAVYVNFQDIGHQLQEIILHHFLQYNFIIKFLLN